MDKRFYQIVCEASGESIHLVPTEDVFECLFWLFSLYSAEIASDEVVDACKHVAECVVADNFDYSFMVDCEFLNITVVEMTSPYVYPEYYASEDFASFLLEIHGKRWLSYREQMRAWYRMANGELIAC